MCSRIDVYLWVIDQCYAKPWGPCISTGSYCPKVYLWSSEVYWRELPCAHRSECLHLAVPKISADQCLALINWYLSEYWSLWHILGIVWKVFLRAFRRILYRGNRASICGVIGRMKFVTAWYWSIIHRYTSILEHKQGQPLLWLSYRHFRHKRTAIYRTIGSRTCDALSRCTDHLFLYIRLPSLRIRPQT